MCSTMVIKTIQYVTACHSPIYVLYMDASKALVCPLILRLLFNKYRKQRIQVLWGNSL